MKNQKYEDAVAQFTNAIQLQPTDIDGYMARGEAYEKLGKFEESYQDFEKARVFDEKNVNILYLIGRVCNTMERYDESLLHLNKATKLAKRESKLYHQKVVTLIGLQRYDRALQASDTALMFKQNEVNLYYRGLAFDRLMIYRRAEEDYKKAISKNKKYIPARLAMAELKIRSNELDEARKHCDYLIELNDKNAAAYTVRSKIYKAQLNYPSAIDDVSRNILIESDVPGHYATRGGYYQDFEQHANAVNDFSRAISLDKANPDYYFERASSYEKLMNFEKAQQDYEKITELSEFNMEARKLLAGAKERLYEINRETDSPEVHINSPVALDKKIAIRGDAEKIVLSGGIKEESLLKSLLINGAETHFERGSNGVYEFLANVDIEDTEEIEIVALDDYGNSSNPTYKINRTEIDPPEIIIMAPYAGDDGILTLENNDNTLFIQGQITDESKIKSIFINSQTASYSLNELNPTFNAQIDILNKNVITVVAEDFYGNKKETQYRLNRAVAQINEDNPMGKTWVVFIENSRYESFASLDGPVKDVNLMQRALSNYDIHKVLVKQNLTRDGMEKFFSIELRDMIRTNQVKSLLVWYAGHGKFVNETGYWIPVDAERDDEFSYFNVANLRAAMEPYMNHLTHFLVVTDACESGPNFYAQMRSGGSVISRSCDDYTATQYRSSQVFTSAGQELASDDSQFTRTFASTLQGNPNSCIPIEDIHKQVHLVITNSSEEKGQEPKLKRIKGLKDENGTFFFIQKKR